MAKKQARRLTKSQAADTERDDPIVSTSISAQDMLSSVATSEAGNLENLGIVQSAGYIPFYGGIDITRDRYQLPLGGFSAIQNMRPLRPGFETRKGCRKLHTTAGKASGTPLSIYMMSKGKSSQRKFLAQWSDGDIQLATNNPPTITTGDFGSDLFSSGTSGLVPASWAMFDDILICADGTGAPLSYPGTNSPVSRFVVVRDTAVHRMMPQKGYDYSTEVTDGDATTGADLSSLGDLTTDYDACYVMTVTPASAFNLAFVSGKVNDTVSSLQLHYCNGNGMWSEVSDLVDGTKGSVEPSPTIVLNEDFEDGSLGVLFSEETSGHGSASHTESGTPFGSIYCEKLSSADGDADDTAILVGDMLSARASLSISFDIYLDRFDNIPGGGNLVIFDMQEYGTALLMTMWVENVYTDVYVLNIEVQNPGGTNFSDSVGISLDTKYSISITWNLTGSFSWSVNSVVQGTTSIDASSVSSGADLLRWGVGTANFAMGTWSPSILLVDNIYVTSSAGSGGDATFTKDGTVSFTMPTDIVPTYMFAKTGYWYRISLSSGDLSSDVVLSSITYEGDMLRIHNVFDDVPSAAIEAYFEDDSAGTTSFYSASAITLDEMTSSDKLYFNFLFPVEAIYIDVGNTPNATATTSITLKYWDGDSFTSVSNKSDGTEGLKQSGWITFARPSMQPSIFKSGSYYSYWFELTVSDTMSADMVIMIEGVPFFDFNDFGKAIALCAWKNRMVYSFDKVPGYVLITADGAPFAINGSDLAIRDVGDGRANKVVAIRRFYNDIMVWQEEKGKDGGCLTMIQGYNPQNFGKLLLSSRYGTFSSKSVVVVDDCPYYEKDREGDARFMGSRTLAFWISREGVFMSNGKTVTGISQDKIRPYFDPASSSCIRRGYENAHWIEYDSRHQGLRIGLVTGTSATKPNTFLFYDIASAAWMTDSLAQPFSCIAEIEADSGDVPVIQVAGGAGDGFIYQTNYGTADVSSAIDSYATMEVSAQNAIVELLELVLRCRVQSSGSVEITPYINGIEQTARSVLMTALVATDGMRRNRIGMDLKGEHLSFRFRNATLNESMVLYDVGFVLMADGRK